MVCIVKAMVFPVVMYRCESWTIKKAEHPRIEGFELWCWRRLLRVPWTAWRSNQSTLKEINTEYSLEGLMLKLKPQYFGLLMWRAAAAAAKLLQSCLTLCDPMDCSMPNFPFLHHLLEFAQNHVHWVGEAIQPSHPLLPLLLLLSIIPCIRVFSSESVLCIRWPKYQSFSLSICPSNKYSGLISLRIDWFDLLAVQGTLKSPLQHHS